MKVTVSNTSMMKPILYTQTVKHAENQHPQRILGLLERTGKTIIEDQVTVYERPNSSLTVAKPVEWKNFLHIPNSKEQLRAAVFGFEFDGENTWYQLWNQNTNRAYWLRHHDDFDYQPYAIMAMDALVSLLPDWNGELHLHLSPENERSTLSEHPQNLPRRQRTHQYDLLISDAATTANGKLWFLVTVKQETTNGPRQRRDEHLRSGWISSKCMVPHAA